MKKIIIVALLAALYSGVVAQTISLDSIKNFVEDSLTTSNYRSLLGEFSNHPEALDSKQGSIVYYGRIFNGFDPYKFDFDEIDFEKLVQKRKYKAAIPKGEELLKVDPANLEVLSMLYTCYTNAQLTGRKELTKIKLDLLTESILMYGDGSSESSTLKIVSIGDEYAMMRILKVVGSSRTTKFLPQSALDIWQAKNSKGKRIDFFAELMLNSETMRGKQ